VTAEIKLEVKKIKKILAVDDEEEILKLYSVFLEEQGYQVTTTTNAVECLKHIKENAPDMILLDVNMPEIDGLRLLEMIRSSEGGKKIPVMMISARRDEKTIKAAVTLGCDNFMIKPFKLKELARRIAIELITIDIDFIHESIQYIRAVKNSFFRQPGLTDLGDLAWDCYPFVRDETDFCIVVARGLRLKSITKAKLEDPNKTIRVFYKHTLRWRQIWP